MFVAPMFVRVGCDALLSCLMELQSLCASCGVHLFHCSAPGYVCFWVVLRELRAWCICHAAKVCASEYTILRSPCATSQYRLLQK